MEIATTPPGPHSHATEVPSGDQVGQKPSPIHVCFWAATSYTRTTDGVVLLSPTTNAIRW